MSESLNVSSTCERKSIIIARLFYSLTSASLLGYFASRFFAYLFWPAYRWLGLLAFVSNVLLVLMIIYLLFSRRWMWLLKVALISGIVVSLELFAYTPDRWLVGQGFRLHTLLSPNYLNSCHSITFKIGDNEQLIGLCYRTSGFEVCEYIVYDEADQLLLPFPQRDPNWKLAMTRLAADTSSMIFDTDEGTRLYGHFYQIHNPPGPC